MEQLLLQFVGSGKSSTSDVSLRADKHLPPTRTSHPDPEKSEAKATWTSCGGRGWFETWALTWVSALLPIAILKQLPEPQKYVKLWPKAARHRPNGKYTWKTQPGLPKEPQYWTNCTLKVYKFMVFWADFWRSSQTVNISLL